MNVQELIDYLNKVDDKSLPIRLLLVDITEYDEFENYWLKHSEIHNTGDSGYEISGEVILIGG